MIKANSEDEAQGKLLHKFAQKEEPYLNMYGDMVKWKFDRFLEIQLNNFQTNADINNQVHEGLEIRTTFEGRRLKPEYARKLSPAEIQKYLNQDNNHRK